MTDSRNYEHSDMATVRDDCCLWKRFVSTLNAVLMSLDLYLIGNEKSQKYFKQECGIIRSMFEKKQTASSNVVVTSHTQKVKEN